MEQNKRIILVTGSTSGIGKQTAKQLLDDDCIVIFNSYEDKNEEQIKQEFGENAFYMRADISKKEDIEKLKNNIEEKFGHLDNLVANAGIMPTPCGIDTITEENIQKTINLNLIGTFWTLKILGKYLQETSTNGSIVTMTSVDGLIGEPYGVIYSATKAGIISLMKSFARHFSNPLVRVNAIAPGLIDTPLSDSTGEDPLNTTDVSIIKRIGKPEEIANTVCFLLSQKASYITGQVIAVDGGFTLK
ncbi:SDR family oxidoreductase [Candidatus Shapirobacteria bacterium]|nr:SDR family oxidoreductase [Candidatus Shapirobacteria bacterium]